MQRLGKVVLLAGKNGSGKSRLLSLVQSAASFFQTKHQTGVFRQRIQELEEIRKKGELSPDQTHHYENYKRDLERATRFELSADAAPEIVAFFPKIVKLEDPYHHGGQETKSREQQTRNFSNGLIHGLRELNVNALSAIQLIQTRHWEASHPRSSASADHKVSAEREYEELNSLILSLLGESLQRDHEGSATLFGFRIGDSKLSGGQAILLQLAVALHNLRLGSRIREAILLIDEPENHLHPAAMLQVISSLESLLADGQLWIATHSVPLLAHFDPSSIWWMENGKVEFAGTAPRRVLEGLLGDEERILKSSDFLNLPFSLASTRFAHQCLSPAPVVQTGVHDPQNKQIADLLKELGIAKLRLLDFGAGRGRLVSFFGATEDPSILKSSLDYVAFDLDSANKESCMAAIDQVYGDSADRYFNRDVELFTARDVGSFDVIVMCNVLHEIPAADWLSLFAAEGTIRRALNPNGVLVLEDMNLPVGELPHQKGFLVLDTPQIKTLFKLSTDDKAVSAVSHSGGRLKAHRIPTAYLGRVDSESRKNALQGLSHSARTEIGRLRQAKGSYQDGRLHGFWLQQFANAQLALEQLA